MPIYKIQKRNGAIVTFNKNKIHNAIIAAMKAVHEPNISQAAYITTIVMQQLENVTDNTIPTIEDIQDTVENTLLQLGHDKVAKAYILYRQQRTMARTDRKITIDVIDSMQEYLHKADRRVNANANQGYSLGGMILNTSGKITANYRLSHIYPADIGNAHRNADIHIHDLDMFCGYCAGRSLRQLLEEGFNGIANKVASTPPKNLQSAVNQMINFLGTLQNEWAGAQAFSSFDTYLAPFVHKYKKELATKLDKSGAQFANETRRERYIQQETYDYVLQQMQNFIFGLNAPSRRGTQTPFTNITLDRVCPEDLKKKALFLGGIKAGPYEKEYGELEEEMHMLNKALIEVYVKGDANGRVFTFPIPTYNITEDFPWNDPAVKGIFEMTAKYGIPYFQNFVGSQFKKVEQPDGTYKKEKNPNAYTPGAVRSMCCRLQLDLTELTKRGNGLFGSAEMTGSIGVVTLNMARIGYQCKEDKKAFIDRVDTLMELAKQSLEIKRKEITKRLDHGLFPFTKRYLSSLRNHFSTIGLNGMNEAIRNFTDDAEHMATNRGQEFAAEILEHMRDKLKIYQEETGNLYNLEATPAEGTTYRFAKEDIQQMPNIIQAGTSEAPYYTNSTQIPVEYTDDAFEALERQNDIQCKYTGGTVLHLYMGERISDADACKLLVQKTISIYQLPYITITPTFSICPKHGYIAGEHDYCPKCDEEIGYSGQRYDLKTRQTYTSDPKKINILQAHTI